LRTTLHLIDPEYERSIGQIAFSPLAISPLVSDDVWEDAFQNGLNQAVLLIEAAVLQLKNRNGIVPNSQTIGLPVSRPKQIFIVHGRDDGCKETVARFVERLDFKAVILHEQATIGSIGVVEKLEANADVVYAIILLTPDDVGRLQSEDNLSPRARQNVIFEFGYFIGRLGRNRVCAMVKDRVELPSDLLGIVYIPFDPAGYWKLGLVRELKSLGLDVDANLAI